MKHFILLFILLVIAACGGSEPAAAAVTTTSGPWGIDAGGFKNLSTALASPATAGKTVVISRAMTINNKTLPADRHLQITRGGRIDPAAGKTFNYNGQSPDAGPYQIHSGAGTITGLSAARPEWQGTGAAAFKAAVDTLMAGGKLHLQMAIYQSPYNTYANRLVKNDVKIQGAGMPNFKSDYTGLENGAIIQGPFFTYAHNLDIRDLGIDVGSAVCASQYGGVAQEGFLISGPVEHTAGPAWRGFVAENLTVISKDPTSAVHAAVFENVDGAIVNNIRTVYGLHGIVFKAQRTNASNLQARGASGEGIIIKSNIYAPSYLSNYTNLYAGSINETTKDGGGIAVYGEDGGVGYEMSNINIVNAIAYKTSYGFRVQVGGGTFTNDISFTNIRAVATSGNGLETIGSVKRLRIVNADMLANGGIGFFFNGDERPECVGCNAYNNVGDGFRINSNGSMLSQVKSFNNTGYGFNLLTTTYINGWTADVTNVAGAVGGTGKPLEIGDEITIAPTLLNSWANQGGAGNSVAGYWRGNGYIHLKGLVRSGTIGQPIFVLPTGYRPAETVRVAVSCFNGSTAVIGQISIAATGEVALEYGANNYITLDGIMFRLL